MAAISIAELVKYISLLSASSVDRRRFVFASAAATVAALASPIARTRAAELLARDLLKEIPLSERIGQLFFFEARGQVMSPGYQADLTNVKPGGVLLVTANVSTQAGLTQFVSDIHASNTIIPPFVCIDQEGGPVTRLQGDPAPGAVQMGLMDDASVTEFAKERATFLETFGIDVNFAPVADVAYDASSTMATRSFGSDPKSVAEKVAATVKGSRSGGVIGAAKHFPGHGRTTVDSHEVIPEIDVPWDEWLKTDAVPFESAIKAKVEMIMLGHLRYDRIDYRPMSLSKVAVRALENDLGFGGVMVTDDLGMGALAAWDPFNKVSQAIDAGVDVMLYGSPPTGWTPLIDHVNQLVTDGIVTRQEINRRVEKIVALKIKHFGLT
jgi:beta-N-acetylhexosaminidase